MELLVATTNLHKLEEIKNIALKWCKKDIVIKGISDGVDIEEGLDYKENAIKKASYYKKRAAFVCAEDSGIELFSLGGAPGPLSSRIGGDDISHKTQRELILYLLKGMKMELRYARYHAEVALLTEKEVRTFTGFWYGYIAKEERGEEGFGYDPIFIPENETKTVAELGNEYKILRSHRAMAFKKLFEYLETNY